MTIPWMPMLRSLWRRKGGALLVVAQVALTLAVLGNAAVVALDRRAQVEHPSGVDEARLFHVAVVTPGYDEAPFAMQRAAEQLLRGLPGVEQAAWVNQLPMTNSGSSTGVSSGDFAVRRLNSSHYSLGQSPLALFGVKLVQGRDFRPDEFTELDLRLSRDPPPGMPMLVTAELARQLYPGADSVLGRTLRLGDSEADPAGVIVGVVERLTSPWGRAPWIEGDPMGERAFITPVRVPERELYAVRVAPGTDPAAVMKQAEQALLAAVPGRVFLGARTLEQTRDQRYRHDRWLVSMLTVVAALLLAMTAAGIVGVASLWVSERRKQIGVRRALGASRRDILEQFVGENLVVAGVGTVLGLVLAVALHGALARWAAMPPLDGAVLAAAALAMPLLAALAALGPSWRASRVSPAEATRSV